MCIPASDGGTRRTPCVMDALSYFELVKPPAPPSAYFGCNRARTANRVHHRPAAGTAQPQSQARAQSQISRSRPKQQQRRRRRVQLLPLTCILRRVNYTPFAALHKHKNCGTPHCLRRSASPEYAIENSHFHSNPRKHNDDAA